MPRVVIFATFRPDGGRRDLLWEFCRPRWEALGWPLYVGTDSGVGSWNRAAAQNDAARQAGDDWDAALVVDADILIDPRQAESAVGVTLFTDAICFGHHMVKALDRPGSQAVLNGDRGDWNRHRLVYTWPDGASMCLAVSRPLWETVGGFDERFAGWGNEDVAFSAACHLLGRGHRRIHGDVWHLWHPANPDRPQGNIDLWGRYRRAVWERPDRDGLLALMSEPGGPLA